MSRAAALALLAGVLACEAPGPSSVEAEHYLRYVAFERRGREAVLLRWKRREMPLRIHLPAPPPGLVEEPEGVREVVRRGVTEWAGVAGPGLPRFRFVGSAGEADIPIVWEESPSGDWYVAHCIYAQTSIAGRFGVERVLVTTRWRGERVPREILYLVVLHEMGHALGLGGHSPHPGDIMYGERSDALPQGLSPRDRETLRRLYTSPLGKRVGGARDAD